MTMPTTEIAASTALDITWVRSQFPSLSQTVHGHPAAFLDGPGGTQVPQRVIDAISDYLRRDNANTGGAYATSRHTDAMLAEARAAMGDFLNCSGDEIVFGPNMTTLTYAMSRAIGRELGPGDEIVVTRLDHDPNGSPGLGLEERGVRVRGGKIHKKIAGFTWTTSARRSTRRPGWSRLGTRRMRWERSIRWRKLSGWRMRRGRWLMWMRCITGRMG